MPSVPELALDIIEIPVLLDCTGIRGIFLTKPHRAHSRSFNIVHPSSRNLHLSAILSMWLSQAHDVLATALQISAKLHQGIMFACGAR